MSSAKVYAVERNLPFLELRRKAGAFHSAHAQNREHTDMEPEIGAWSTLEYIAIASETRAAGSKFYLSSLQPQLASNLPEDLQATLSVSGDSFVATTQDVETLNGVAKERVCLLDPQASTTLSPEDGYKFDWFVFGGILGW
jgi:ribosome biogenesis SPOUT family RNA methylase Rps3